MALTSVHSKGTVIKRGDGASPEVFTTIGGINDVPSISSNKSALEDTAIGDTIRHYGYGLGEPAEITLSMFWNPDDTMQSGLITDHDNETERNFQAVMPDSPATTYDFTAIVTGYTTPAAGINEFLMWEVTLQLLENASGDIVTAS